MAAFPSLVIRGAELEPRGAFAQAQAAFLAPDRDLVARLDAILAQQRIGVVAHFYMDPELQGVLAACEHEHIHISDSLLMADSAVKMAAAGMRTIVVLGVDFMSENVRAMLDAAGRQDVPVYRVAAEPIGCSLAEAARSPAYGAYLAKAAKQPRSLHVIYINTSLDVKARAHATVPTITCTSSNVVQTALQAFAEVPEAHVWFGPDTYMGRNLVEMLRGLAETDDATVRHLHAGHDRASLRAALERFHHFEQGSCVVHHMFGAEVVAQVERDYPDAFVTAHFEVPGEMFALALAAQKRGRGVVGSTSNILSFIAERVKEKAAAKEPATLRFVLGTEAGMITSIVRDVQKALRETKVAGLAAEIIFPVAAEAVAQTGEAELAVVPGVAGGEGCSTAGGCATCPYMKMNSLDALFDLVEGVAARRDLARFHPRLYAERVAGRTAADLGGEPILHMRALGKTGRLPEALVRDIVTRGAHATDGAPPPTTS